MLGGATSAKPRQALLSGPYVLLPPDPQLVQVTVQPMAPPPTVAPPGFVPLFLPPAALPQAPTTAGVHNGANVIVVQQRPTPGVARVRQARKMARSQGTGPYARRLRNAERQGQIQSLVGKLAAHINEKLSGAEEPYEGAESSTWRRDARSLE